MMPRRGDFRRVLPIGGRGGQAIERVRHDNTRAAYSATPEASNMPSNNTEDR
jgi:hypothetical protein